MDIAAFQHRLEGGWSVSGFPDLDSPRTLITVFGAPEYRDREGPIRELVSAFPRATVVGCSTAGEIAGSVVSDRSLSVAVTRFEGTDLRRSAVTGLTPGGSFAAGAEVAARLASPDLRAVFVVSDGLCVNGTALTEGIASQLSTDVVVTGGLAGDGAAFRSTWILDAAGVPAEGAVCAVGFYGPRIRVRHGSRGGWDPFGPTRRVTRSEGSVVYALDGEPALDLYQRYLGEKAAGLPATGLLYPLSLRRTLDSEKRLVRTILAVDEAARSITFAGDVPQGWEVQLMKANFDRLVGGASDAAQVARDGHDGTAVLAIAVSCVGRRLVLGERIEEETEATLHAMPHATQVGFYSYGEISPYVAGQSCDLHNQTMTLTTYAER